MTDEPRTRGEKKRAWVQEQIARAEALLANPNLPAEKRPNLERVLANLKGSSKQPSATVPPAEEFEIPKWPRLRFYGTLFLGFLAFGIFGVLMGWIDGQDRIADCYYYATFATDC